MPSNVIELQLMLALGMSIVLLCHCIVLKTCLGVKLWSKELLLLHKEFSLMMLQACRDSLQLLFFQDFVQGLETKEEYNGNVFSMWKNVIKLQLMQAVGMSLVLLCHHISSQVKKILNQISSQFYKSVIFNLWIVNHSVLELMRWDGISLLEFSYYDV